MDMIHQMKQAAEVRVCVCTRACMYVCMYVCSQADMCMYVCMYACASVEWMCVY